MLMSSEVLRDVLCDYVGADNVCSTGAAAVGKDTEKDHTIHRLQAVRVGSGGAVTAR